MNIDGLDVSYKELLTTEFTKQQYLKYTPGVALGNDAPIYSFTWGCRAELEVDKKDILEFVSDVFNCEPSDWTEHFKDAYGEDANDVTLVEDSS